jgi:hypothetical protein
VRGLPIATIPKAIGNQIATRSVYAVTFPEFPVLLLVLGA